MRVIDYINQANPLEVARLYSERWGEEDGWHTPASFIEFRLELNRKITIHNGQEQMRVILRRVLEEGQEHWDVSGAVRGPSSTTYALSLTPWGEWKTMDVQNESSCTLSLDEIATLLYHEITWHGWEENVQEMADTLHDMAQEIDRDFADWKRGDLLPEGYTDVTPRFPPNPDE